MKPKISFLFVFAMMLVMNLASSCTSSGPLVLGKNGNMPLFSTQHWHIDSLGNAKSSSGLEFGFGSEWMVTDTALIQTPEKMCSYSKLSSFLAKGMGQFREIAVDSIYFYNPARGLLFVAYHQVKPLKPTVEVSLHNDTIPVYSKEYARIFGVMNTYIDDKGWENGPVNSVYSNVRYNVKAKQFVLLQRIPYRGGNIAVFHICATIPKKGKWWEEYPSNIFWSTDLGNLDNIEKVASFLHSSRTVAVANLLLSQQ